MANEKIDSATKQLLAGSMTDAEIEKLIAETARKETLRGFIVTELGRADISAEELSERANIARSTIYKILNGKMKPEGDRLLQIAFALKLDAEKTQKMLRLGGRAPLNTDTERDIRIILGLKRHLMLEEINDELINTGLKPIGRPE